jgi:hypothetical protein
MSASKFPWLIVFILSQFGIFVIPWLIVLIWLVVKVNGRTDENFIATCVGIGFAQINLAAACLALGPFSLKARFAIATVIGMFAYIATACSFLGEPGRDVYLGLLVGFVAEFVVIQTPLWLMRWQLGLRIVHYADLTAEESIRSRQFTIRELFLTTTFIAVLLGIGRAVFSSLSDFPLLNSGRDVVRMISLFLMIAGFNLLLAWPAIGSVLIARGQLFTIPLAICIAAAATYYESHVFNLLFGPGPQNQYLFFGCLNGPHFLLLLISLGITRAFGYRLIRRIEKQ